MKEDGVTITSFNEAFEVTGEKSANLGQFAQALMVNLENFYEEVPYSESSLRFSKN